MQPLSPSDRALGDLLLDRRVLTLRQLDEATALAERWHVRLGDAVLARDWIEPAAYYRTLAQHYSLPFVDVLNEPPDPSLLSAADVDIYSWTATMPYARRDGRLWIVTADPGPDTLLFARQKWGSNIAFAVASRFDVSWAVQSAFQAELSQRAVYALATRDPLMSARHVANVPQVLFGYAAITACLLGFVIAPVGTLIALNVLMSLFYLGNFLLKGILVSIGGGRSVEADHAIAIAARSLTDDELPVYTVLVPMYREARMLPMLAQALRNLDYPLGKLDIKLVLEADDHETVEVARTLGLEGVFEVIRVPPSQPKTKPKACNYALTFARGEYLVVYDAEDRPEPDQLRKVVAAFAQAPEKTACLQCRLNYYNASDNWLTRMFTLDYSLWFDQVLPGLERLNIPIPLGGTSNHFKISVLRELRAWDPFNVTEDADLGIRMTQKGYRVGIVDSTTFEEAAHEAGAWIRQRSRWIKGYLQTLLVHTRRPLHLIKTTGLLGFIGFILFIGGTALSGLLNPVFWVLYLVWLIALWTGLDPVFPQILLFLSLLNLLAGNGAFIFLSMLAPLHRGWLNLIPYSLTVIGYWVLMSVAAYRALWQLLRNPFYWEKTPHGRSRHILRELRRARELRLAWRRR